ncbi:MAG: hypothetical protein FWF03_05295 [Defluviitaleaceae bacterium]|nr:hypothetical protein [Defluviitaleaceae bacterium]
MNIIRTKVAELSAIPAIAYKIKLSSGGSGVKLHRTDRSETAFAVIDKRTGEFLPDKRTDSAIFPDSAFEEALSELAGLPYSSRGKVLIAVSNESDSNEITAPELEETADEAKLDGISQAARVFFSDEFAAITERFADENGKLNYQLMNKQFIQFASGSKVVSEMCGKKASEGDILLFIVKNRAAYLAGKRENISDDDAKALIETIDEIDPRSAFKELKLYIRKRMAR